MFYLKKSNFEPILQDWKEKYQIFSLKNGKLMRKSQLAISTIEPRKLVKYIEMRTSIVCNQRRVACQQSSC